MKVLIDSIQNRVNNIKPQYILMIALCLFTLTNGLNLLNVRPIFCDEGWYTNSAYHFYEGGWIKNTNVGSGGDLNFVFPLIQGLLFKIFGYSFYLARFASVFGGIVSIVLFFKIFKTLGLSNSSILIALMTFTGGIIYNHAFTMARPESWCIAFILFSIYQLLHYYQNGKNKNLTFLGIGVGMAFLTHPDTLAFAFAVGLYLFIQTIRKKKILSFLYFATPPLLALIIFIINNNILYDAMPIDAFTQRSASESGFIDKIFTNLNASTEIFTIASRVKILNSIILTAILLAGLFLKKKNKLIFYSSILGIAVWLISIIAFSKIAYLYVYVFLFAIINMAILVEIYKKYSFSIIILPIMMIASIIGINNLHKTNIHSILENELDNTLLPKGAKVFGPIELWNFVPQTKYITYNYRPNEIWKETEVTPSNINYFIYYKNADMGSNNSRAGLVNEFLNYKSKTLIYEKESTYYERIYIYKLN